MADYHPLIARAVAGLEKSTGEARRTLYDRARHALVAQLSSVDPPLNDSDITRERLALEDAIRKVEAEASRKARTEPPNPEPASKVRAPDAKRWEAASKWDEPPTSPAEEPPPVVRKAAMPPWPEPAPLRPLTPRLPPESSARASDNLAEGTDEANEQTAEPQPSAPEQATPAAAPRMSAGDGRSLLDSGLRDFRHVVSEADELASAHAMKSARDTFDFVSEPSEADRAGQRASSDGALTPDMLEASYVSPSPAFRPAGKGVAGEIADSEFDDAPHAPPRSYRELIRVASVLLVVLGVGGLVTWQWPAITYFYRLASTPSVVEAPKETQPTTRPKIADRLDPGGPQLPVNPVTQPGAAVAQRVVLYEEDPTDPQGKRYVGSAIWRTETISPGAGKSPELAVRADIEIPDLKLAMTWSLRRNTDQSLPATHTVEIMFRLPPNFPSGGISNVPGILMKQTEQTRGVALAGLAVKVTNGFFLIGLSATEADRERNVQLLKERSWLDIPVVYTNNRRAILALEKGTPGERAFADAFKAWGQ
jgi:hypothetical protein